MLVPAAAVQQNVPLFYMNPAAPNVQGRGPVFLTYSQTGQVIPQQMPVAFIPNQPATTQTSKPVMKTVSSSSQTREASASTQSSFDTRTTFSVLPQNVGQSAVEKAQKQYSGGVVKQPSATYHNSAPGPQRVAAAAAGAVQQGPRQHTETRRQNTESVTPETNHNHTPNSKVISRQQESGQPSFEKSEDVRSGKTKKTDGNGPAARTQAYVSSSGPSFTGSQIPALNSSPVSTMRDQPPLSEVSKKPAVEPVYNTSSPEQISSLTCSVVRKSEGSILVADVDPNEGDLKPPFRKAGRTVSWRYRTQGKSKLQERRKALARDLKGKCFDLLK